MTARGRTQKPAASREKVRHNAATIRPVTRPWLQLSSRKPGPVCQQNALDEPEEELQMSKHCMKFETTVGAYRSALALVLGAVSMLPFHTQAQDAMVLSDEGYVGMGLDNPERLLHLQGDNAIFRMDRTQDTAAFILVRTNNAFAPLKTFVVGVNATGTNNGELVINDLGSATSGPGTTRLRITNTGTVIGNFSNTSSARYKEDVETLTQATESLTRLRGVRFNWKDSGDPSLGLIAEEVASVYPELVTVKNGHAEAVNYAALVAVMVEAFKEQQAALDAQQVELAAYRQTTAKQRNQLDLLQARLTNLETVQTRVAALESMLIGNAQLVATSAPSH